MRALWSSLTLAVTMAALALFGAGGGIALARAESTSATLHGSRQQNATVASGQRGGSSGALSNGGRKSPRASFLRLQPVAAIVPQATHPPPPSAVGHAAAGRAELLYDNGPHCQRLARAPPI